MAPVEWKDGWPLISPGHEEVQYKYPIDAKRMQTSQRFNGNYQFKDDFRDTILNKRYSFLRTVREPLYDLKNSEGYLAIKLRPQTCQGTGNPSFIAFRQPHLYGYAATALRLDPFTDNEKAGLMIFQNETHYYYLCLSREQERPVVQLYKGPGKSGASKEPELLVSVLVKPGTGKQVFFKIESQGGAAYAFYYATRRNKWRLLRDKVDGKFLSTKQAGGFVGAMYVLYATSNGNTTARSAYYDWFECRNNDKTY